MHFASPYPAQSAKLLSNISQVDPSKNLFSQVDPFQESTSIMSMHSKSIVKH